MLESMLQATKSPKWRRTTHQLLLAALRTSAKHRTREAQRRGIGQPAAAACLQQHHTRARGGHSSMFTALDGAQRSAEPEMPSLPPSLPFSEPLLSCAGREVVRAQAGALPYWCGACTRPLLLHVRLSVIISES